jgi:hypothetical protein
MSELANEIAVALRQAAPPPIAPISQTELAKYSPEQRQAFAAVLSQHGFAKADVSKIAPPIEAPAAPVAVIDSASPEGYRLRYASEILTAKDVPAADAAIRGALATAQVPVGLSQSLVDTVSATARTVASLPSEEARAAYFQDQGKVLIHTYGQERATELGALAEAALARLGADFLNHAGPFGGHSAQSIVTLAALQRTYLQKHPEAKT